MLDIHLDDDAHVALIMAHRSNGHRHRCHRRRDPDGGIPRRCNPKEFLLGADEYPAEQTKSS